MTAGAAAFASTDQKPSDFQSSRPNFRISALTILPLTDHHTYSADPISDKVFDGYCQSEGSYLIHEASVERSTSEDPHSELDGDEHYCS